MNVLAEIFRLLAIPVRYPSLEFFNQDYLAARVRLPIWTTLGAGTTLTEKTGSMLVYVIAGPDDPPSLFWAGAFLGGNVAQKGRPERHHCPFVPARHIIAGISRGNRLGFHGNRELSLNG